MSHMAVLVNTQTLDESELRRVLQPYHEFECTGVEGALAVTTEAVNNGVAVAKKTAETAATVATAAVEGAVAGVKQATSADKKSDE